MYDLKNMPPVLTVPEAAKILRVGRNSLFRAIQRGEVPALRIGKRVLIPRMTLERLLGLDLSKDEQDEEAALFRRFNARRELWAGR